MAIGTYAELQTAVANWLNRDDLTENIPDFITLCEARLNRVLRTRAMEGLYTASTVAAQRDYNLPPNYLQMRALRLNTSPLTVLEYVSPEIMDRVWAGSSGGKPVAYTIKANELFLGPSPGSVYTMEMDYYRKFDSLSNTTTTNAMLTDNPDVYLYGSLLEAEPFIKNDTRIQVWGTSFYKAITDIQDQDAKDRHSGSEMRIRNTSGYT
jgi:hypothetical protein